MAPTDAALYVTGFTLGAGAAFVVLAYLWVKSCEKHEGGWRGWTD